jgi:hypothetical protein
MAILGRASGAKRGGDGGQSGEAVRTAAQLYGNPTAVAGEGGSAPILPAHAAGLAPSASGASSSSSIGYPAGHDAPVFSPGGINAVLQSVAAQLSQPEEVTVARLVGGTAPQLIIGPAGSDVASLLEQLHAVLPGPGAETEDNHVAARPRVSAPAAEAATAEASAAVEALSVMQQSGAAHRQLQHASAGTADSPSALLQELSRHLPPLASQSEQAGSGQQQQAADSSAAMSAEGLSSTPEAAVAPPQHEVTTGPAVQPSSLMTTAFAPPQHEAATALLADPSSLDSATAVPPQHEVAAAVATEPSSQGIATSRQALHDQPTSPLGIDAILLQLESRLSTIQLMISSKYHRQQHSERDESRPTGAGIAATNSDGVLLNYLPLGLPGAPTPAAAQQPAQPCRSAAAAGLGGEEKESAEEGAREGRSRLESKFPGEAQAGSTRTPQGTEALPTVPSGAAPPVTRQPAGESIQLILPDALGAQQGEAAAAPAATAEALHGKAKAAAAAVAAARAVAATEWAAVQEVEARVRGLEQAGRWVEAAAAALEADR